MRYVISIDQGTTGTTVLILDEDLHVTGRANCEFRQIYPKPGWVEHNPEAIWSSVVKALTKALDQASIDPQRVAAVGITNQRETTLLWERNSLRPVHNALVWQDRRTAPLCESLKNSGHEELIRAKTGLVVDPYFSGTKLQWLFQEYPDLRKRAHAGELAFGTVDSYLVAKLTGGAVHITDVTNASRTLLCDLRTLEWSTELTDLFEVPRAVLPTICSSAEVYGHTHDVPGLPNGIPIAGIAGDQQAALFGQACFRPGEAKCTFGTGAFILMNTGPTPVSSNNGLLTTCAWKLGAGEEAGEICYALEGSAFIAGAAVQWLRDGLGVIDSAAQIEALARTVPGSDGVTFVPAMTGLGAPHWRPDARGIICGITRGTTKAHLARAALEGIALQNYDILRAMEQDAQRMLTVLKVDGGASANDLLMELQADILNVEISRPRFVETTALGAAFLAGLTVGIWTNKGEISRSWAEQHRFYPQEDRGAVAVLLDQWNQAVANA